MDVGKIEERAWRRLDGGRGCWKTLSVRQRPHGLGRSRRSSVVLRASHMKPLIQQTGGWSVAVLRYTATPLLRPVLLIGEFIRYENIPNCGGFVMLAEIVGSQNACNLIVNECGSHGRCNCCPLAGDWFFERVNVLSLGCVTEYSQSPAENDTSENHTLRSVHTATKSE
jgi:hypothetical protein